MGSVVCLDDAMRRGTNRIIGEWMVYKAVSSLFLCI